MATWTTNAERRQRALLLLATLLLPTVPADASESALVEVFSLGLDSPVAAELGEWEGYCRTGSFGARERWIIFTSSSPVVPLLPQYTQERGSRKPVKGDFLFANLDRRNVVSPSPPCYEMTKKLLKLQMTQLSATEDRFDEQLGRYVIVGVRSPFSHSYAWDDDTRSFAPPAVRQNDQAHEDSHHHPEPSVTIEQEAERNDMEDAVVTFSFAFQSCVDTIDAVAQLLQEQVASVDMVRLLGNDNIVGHLMQEERDLLVLLPSGSLEASWTSAFSLEDWALLRQKTPEADRKALATSWTDLANHNGSSDLLATRVNCLRRALAWYPGFVPSYLALATSLNQPDASCLIMEKILEHVDPSEFHSSEMRSVLTMHFPHCSTVLRMANLWETNAFFRYLITFSVVFSTIRGIWIVVSFTQDNCQWVWRSEKLAAR